MTVRAGGSHAPSLCLLGVSHGCSHACAVQGCMRTCPDESALCENADCRTSFHRLCKQRQPEIHVSAHFQRPGAGGGRVLSSVQSNQASVLTWGGRGSPVLCKSGPCELSVHILDADSGGLPMGTYSRLSACLAGARTESTPEAAGRP